MILKPAFYLNPQRISYAISQSHTVTVQNSMRHSNPAKLQITVAKDLIKWQQLSLAYAYLDF